MVEFPGCMRGFAEDISRLGVAPQDVTLVLPEDQWREWYVVIARGHGIVLDGTEPQDEFCYKGFRFRRA